MKRLALTLAIGLLTTQAHAHHGHHHHKFHRAGHFHRLTRTAHVRHERRAVHFSDSRPVAWCGWYMRHLMGVTDAAYNLARNWAGWGRDAGGPGPGVVVVWPHHVGLIVGHGRGGLWVVKSGNDGHAVRERPRSLAGAIAFRRAG